MPDLGTLEEFLAGARVDPAVFALRPDYGVTCRRWNWRQGRRTQLREDTTAALFILDALAPMTDEALAATADDLVARLTRLGPGIRAAAS